MAGVLTRQQMRNEVLDNISRTATAQMRSGTTLETMGNRWLNRASMRIARKNSLLFREATASTTANQSDYAFPDRFRAIYTLRLEDGTNSRKLRLRMPETVDRFAPKPDSLTTAIPVFYIPRKTENNYYFELFRIPDNTYTMRAYYSFWPTPMDEDTDKSDYNYLDDAIIAFATAYGYGWLQEMKDYRFWEQRGMDFLEEQLEAEEGSFPDWMPKGRGFSIRDPEFINDFYNDPFIFSDPSIPALSGQGNW